MLCSKIIILCVFIGCATSYNILGVFPYEGRSHFMLFEPLLREIAARGHNLTVISYFPQTTPIKNYHDISLAEKSKVLESVFPIERSYWTIFQITLFLVNYGTENCRVLLEDTNVQNLWKSKAKFDVVIVEQFQSDCSLGLAYKLGAPVVGITSHLLMPYHYDRHGFYYNPSYMNSMMLGGGTKPTLYQRIERNVFDIYIKLFYKHFSQNIDQKTLSQYVGDVPPLEELAQGINILLLYQNFVSSGTNILPGKIKEVAGFHVAKPKDLDTDLKKFIDESEHGVIYISFGSMLRARTTPKDKLEAIMAAVSELPQRVVMKWDDNNLPGNPKNIFVSSWLPQNDILAHPNVLAFMSHCGCLGTTEAFHYGVPILGMPVFGDQPGNAAMIEESGFGVQIQVSELSKELLLQKFKTILNPAFRAQVKDLSKAWHDRPLSAMDTAIFWTEFVARNKKIILRSSAVDTPAYQYYHLDVLLIFLTCIVGLLFVFVKSLTLFFSSKKKTKKD